LPGVYTKAATLDPDLKNAYAVCRRIVRRRNPDEYALAKLIPSTLRPACWAVWAAGSAADDLVDHGGDPQRRAAALAEWPAPSRPTSSAARAVTRSAAPSSTPC